MEFRFDDDALLLQSTLRDFLAKECTPELVRALWQSPTGRSPALWQRLSELGVQGALVPEARGGLGLDETRLVGLLEETGRAALAEPVVETAAVAVPLLSALGDAGQADAWLERIARGEARVAVGHPANTYLSDAHVADLLLLPAEGALHAVAPGAVRLTPEPSNDPSRRIFSVAWTPTPASRVAQGEAAARLLADALERGALACAAQALGVAERLLELAVAYARERRQFGRPIGSFQAVKHQLADARVSLEYARPQVERAAWSVARRTRWRGLHVSMAKLAACEAATGAARSALQVHGAIGYTWELDLHLWMRRAWSLELSWGRRDLHERRVREALLVEGAPIGPGTTFEEG